jgi:hypothetical protein
MLSFSADEESQMVVELAFTNDGGTRISDSRSVYLAIDDNAGVNHLRRPLRAVDLGELAPGERRTFSDRLPAPAFRPGHYRIYLWAPSPDPSVTFDSASNFLFSSVGIADFSTGLNSLATLTVR